MKELNSHRFMVFFILCLLNISYVVKSLGLGRIDTKLLSNTNTNANTNPIKIYFQGWIKYMVSNKLQSKPSLFFKNSEFVNQRYPVSVVNNIDKFGKFIIPDESSFFAVLYKDKLAIYSGRDDIIKRVLDVLEISTMNPIPEDDIYLGSVKTFEKTKAGYCLSISLDVDYSNKKTKYWTICFEDDEIRSSFIKTIAKLKIESQRKNDLIIRSTSIKEENKNDKDKEEEASSGTEKSFNDARLVLLQDWSDCTLKCGGGKSFQQWMCIPPKEGGKPCPNASELIKEKKCNTDPCPEVITREEKPLKLDLNIKPIVKIARFSNRFNRYVKCEIKETDIFKIDNDNRIPSRFVMNTNSISIFSNDDYMNLDMSFNLKDTDFKVDNKSCCFELKENSKSSIFCGFDAACGDPEQNLFVKNLEKVFNEFKNECNNDRETQFLTEEDEMKIKKHKTAYVEVKTQEKEKEILKKTKNNMEDSAINLSFQKVKETNKLGLKALERELLIEELIKKDEEKKESLKESELKKEIKKEKIKNREISEKIEEKELDEELKIEELEVEKDSKESQQEFTKQIEVNREKLKNKLKELKTQAKTRREDLRGKLKKIKDQISFNLIKATHKGSNKTCIEGLDKQDVRTKYCNQAFPDDYLENQNCREEEEFCYSCCNNEFGSYNALERDNCYNTCDKEKDNLKNKANPPKEKKPEQWKWKPNN